MAAPSSRGGWGITLILGLLSFYVSTIAAFLTPIVELELPELPSGYDASKLPLGKPKTPPPYMVNNQGNVFGAAPDRGSLNGPITSDAQLLHYDESEHHAANQTAGSNYTARALHRRSSDFWMDGITHGEMPFAPSGYEFYRNVMDYGATGDGTTDDTAAINRAISDGNRCGENCGSTSVLGALVYFPPGTYLISTPIIQYYYTQFVGDPNDRPTIKGSQNFTGIALIDTDPYIPGGSGSEWYINQNQFYRQIRNFELDMTDMNFTNYDAGQAYVPTGIHWQVAQATSMQNIYFNMPESTADETTTAVGIFMENGSGGFLSDLEFYGGNIGFRAGTQQYTARNLKFTSCLTGVSMIWDWGFTWKNVEFDSVWVAFDCTSVGSEESQGTGSIAVVDSTFYSVPYPITLRNGGPYPDIILDNLLVQDSASIVLISGGDTLFEGSSGSIYIEYWAYGRRYTSIDGTGTETYGLLDISPQKPESLLDGDGDYFTKSRPQYETYAASDFIVATANNISNDATGDQTDAINTLLSDNVGTPIFFPAGIYLVKSTVFVPVGSIILGEGWSQIMGTGEYFEDELNPQVMVQVGYEGDSGTLEISDMLFTVKGPTAGAILMEWNVRESTQGSAGMWDSHFRVGGANGTDLQMTDCPKSDSVNKDCMAASMLLHLTSTSSGYFENVWAWVADHDLDVQISSSDTDTSSTQLNIYAARGVLIESQGPTWFYGCASEHSVLYQYQLYNAKDIYLGHIQTETPYFQDTPAADEPFTIGTFESDPTFDDCSSGSNCEKAWALQVVSSENVFIYSAGLYSFFESYSEDCLDDESCQERLMQTSYTQGLWMYNLFTIGATEMVYLEGSVIPPTYQADNKNGYSTDISAWLVLAEQGADIGSSGDAEEDGSGVVYIDPIVFGEPSPIFQCYPPCTMVMPTSTSNTSSTITYAPWSGNIVVGGSTVSAGATTAHTTTVVVGGSTVPTTITTTYTTSAVVDGSTVTSTVTTPYTTSVAVGGTTVTTTITAASGAVVEGGTTITTTVTPTPVVTNHFSFWPLYVPSGHGSFTFNMTTMFQPPAVTISANNGTYVITPPAQSTHYGSWDSTEPYNTVLPTTVVSANGTVQTYSEDQITSLATMTTTTYITTVWGESETSTATGSGSSSSSSTTLVPVVIPVTKGGFYWSAMPNEKGPKFPTIDPPGFPSIPTPSCFKFLDIFSIDCPPNDNKAAPTSTFSSGPNSPSCSSHCGTLPKETGSSVSSSTSTSTCTTQTVTSCRTLTTATPYSTVCAEYEGCECATKTVTDYAVSCDLTTCTTTSSSVKTGCYVTEESSTTGEYCVSGVTVLSGDDQGNNGLTQLLTLDTASASTSYPESVVISGQAYTPSSGEIVVGGSTLSVPSVTSQTTVTISGTPVVIYPGGTGPLVTSILTTEISTASSGAEPGNSASQTTAAPTTTSTKAASTKTTSTSTKSTSTSTKTTSTKTTSTKTSTSSSKTASPTAELIIALDTDPSSLNAFEWEFVTPAIGGSFTACDGVGSEEAPNNEDSLGYPYPDGDWTLPFKIHDMSDCVYKGTSDGPGTFTCPDMSETVQCTAWDGSTTPIYCYGFNVVEMRPMVVCEW